MTHLQKFFFVHFLPIFSKKCFTSIQKKETSFDVREREKEKYRQTETERKNNNNDLPLFSFIADEFLQKVPKRGVNEYTAQE